MAIQLQDKWQRVCAYSGLTDEDLQLLHTHQSLFESTKDSVVDKFYDVLENHPNLVAIVEANSTISRLKQTQLWYYASLGDRDIDDAYIAGREKIGLVHARIGLSPDWYMSATTLYLRLFSDVVAGHEQELELIRAFSRRLMFDAAVILQQYDNAYRDNMKSVATQVENSMAEVSEIASEYAASAEFLSQSQETINQSMKQLVLYSRDIEKVSRLVMGVADQTHLLGLNAAIESARAGEHGRGFAVVAGEVRKLSEEVMKSSKDIQDSIHRIISQVQAMSDQVEATLQISTDQTAAAEELSALIDQVESFTQTWSQQSKK